MKSNSVSTEFLNVLKGALSLTYTNFHRLLKGCDIILSNEVVTYISILSRT